jgi:FkbM family methyltransferase
MNEQIKLNLGSGALPLPGYRNIDCKLGLEAYPLTFSDNSIDEVRASHILEHFSHKQTADVIKEWVRVLKPGGALKIAVPDFDIIAKSHINGSGDHPNLEGIVYGGQSGDADFHKSLFTERKLAKLLTDAGLIQIQRWTSEQNDDASLPVSLNLMAMKPYRQANAATEFLKDAKGVIHVGASTGQERDIYAAHGLPVIWIEALPGAYEQLAENIACYENQQAFNYLITDKDGEEYNFNVSSNRGESSSIFELENHKQVWPEIEYTHSIRRTSATLKTVIERHAIDLAQYDTLILDVQGAELLALTGLGDLVNKFRFIRCEADDGQFYAGACQLRDLDGFFSARNFERVKTWQYSDSARPYVSHLYEALYAKKMRIPSLTPIFIEDEQTGAKALYKVAAVTTVPRLGFQAHAGVLERAFSNPRMLILRTGGVFWEMGIQNGINSLINLGADYVITIDYDSIFTNDDVRELLKLVVRYPDADAIAAWQVKRGSTKDEALAGLKTKDGKMGAFVSLDEMKANDLTRVDNTVFGLTIIKTAAIKKMKKPWFINTPNKDGDWTEGKHDADSYFWHKFGEAGNTIYMANRVRIGHLQEVVLWVDDDFNFSKQELSEWHRSGRPCS